MCVCACSYLHTEHQNTETDIFSKWGPFWLVPTSQALGLGSVKAAGECVTSTKMLTTKKYEHVCVSEPPPAARLAYNRPAQYRRCRPPLFTMRMHSLSLPFTHHPYFLSASILPLSSEMFPRLQTDGRHRQGKQSSVWPPRSRQPRELLTVFLDVIYLHVLITRLPGFVKTNGNDK